jgi:PEGA domain
MKKSSRYLLIALGLLVFFVIAPLLILYVSGKRLNFSDSINNATGILDAKSQPNGATVFLDGIEKTTTPGILRFLNQGEYSLKITYDGYYDWSKRLPIESGKVTYAQEGVPVVQLIKKSAPQVLASGNITAFTFLNDNAWYAQNNSVVKISPDNSITKQAIALPFSPNSIVALRDKKYLLAQDGESSALIDSNSGKVFFTPSNIPLAEDAVVVSSTRIIYRDGKTLHLLDTAANTNVILRDQVAGFIMVGTNAYFLDIDPVEPDQATATAAVWNGSQFTDIQQLLSGINISNNNKLLITDNRELFCLCGSQLSRISQKLELVNGAVKFTRLDFSTNELVFSTGSELWFYNFLTNKPQLLTRSTAGANDFLIRSNIGYGFIGNNQGLEIVEIDTRDRQNRYPLLQAADGAASQPVWQIAMTSDEKTILALQDGSLYQIMIRD